jgi:hypothetical protein
MTTRPFKAPLKLSTSGELSLFFIGIGGAFSKVHYQTNLLIMKGEDYLLVDCGARTPQAFAELGLSISNIDTFLITHSHADHIGGMEEVLLMGRYVKKKKPSIIIPAPYRRILWNYSLKGGVAFNEEHNRKPLAFNDVAELLKPLPWDGLSRDAYHYRHGSIDLKLIRTMHIPENAASWKESFWSTALVIDNRVFFTGDTRYDPLLVREVEKVFSPECIFHDCQFFTGGVHAGLSELSKLPKPIKRKCHLVHYGDKWQEEEERVKKAGFAGLTRQWLHYDFP